MSNQAAIPKKTSGRNSLVELFRFLFTVCVILAHLQTVFENNQLKFKWNGHIAVEFFFVLSGYLMAAQCMKRRDDGVPLWRSTWTFVKRKAVAIAPIWYVVLFHFVATRAIAYTNKKFIHMSAFLLRMAPSFVFASGYGIKETASIPFSWYIPVMLVSMLILYPMIRKWGKNFICIVAPLVVLFYCAWAMQVHNSLLMLEGDFYGFVYPKQIRGLGDLCMGLVAYAISDALRARFQNRLTLFGRMVATLIGVAMYALPIIWLILGLRGEAHPMVLMMFGLGTAVLFSGLDLSDKIPSWLSKVFCWLGKISLSLYLCQSLVVKTSLGAYTSGKHPLIYFLTCFAVAIIVHYLAQLLVILWRKLCKGFAKLCIKQPKAESTDVAA